MSEQKNIIPLGRQDFDRDLGKLEAELILMSGLVEQAIFNALNALKSRDIDKSQKVIDEDDNIDQTELEIERSCIELIRREAPMAGDLRRIVASLHIAGELERIGDYAEGIELEKEADEVDDLYAKVQVDLLKLVKAAPENAERATYLMRVAHNVERVADRAMNIVERALYQATGELVSGSTQIEALAE